MNACARNTKKNWMYPVTDVFNTGSLDVKLIYLDSLSVIIVNFYRPRLSKFNPFNFTVM